MQTSHPLISVVIPVYNGGNDFRRCLKALTTAVHCKRTQEDRNRDAEEAPLAPAASLAPIAPGELIQPLAQKNPQREPLGDCLAVRPAGSAAIDARTVEIIVVSDGDSDGSWRLAEAFGVRLIRLPESGGPAKARNIGAKAASGDILFFVDADVEVHLDTLTKVAESFEADANLAALIGSYDDAPGAPNFLSQYKNLIHHYTHQQAGLEASTFWGACGAIRRHVFEAVGGFDEGYRRPCIEDIELGYRLKYAGYPIHLRADIQVKHLKRWTPTSLLRADIFYRALPWMDLLLQVQRTRPAFYQQFTQELNLKWSSKVSVILVFGLLLSGMGAGIVAGMDAIAFGTRPTSWEWASRYSFSWMTLLLPALLCGLGLLWVNLPVYRFFYQRHGWLFAIKTVPWHWLYFFYSGLVYVYTVARYRLRSG